MADYIAAARSNYFRVTDLKAFREDLERHGITVTSWDAPMMGDLVLETDEANEPQGAVALFAAGSDHGTWPTFEERDEIVTRLEDLGLACNSYAGVPDELCDTCDEPESEHTDTRSYATDITELVARHLIDGDVAVFMESGSERFRFVGGAAVAVNNKGEVVSLDLHDIYAKAADLGETVTHAML